MIRSILDNPNTLPLDGNTQISLFKELKSLGKSNDRYKEILDELIVHNVRLIAKYANGLYDANELEIDDIIAIGVPALIKAIEKFNPYMDVPFSSYAKRWIQTEIHRKAFEEYLAYHLSIRDYELLKSYYSYEIRLLNEKGIIDRDEIFKEMDLSKDKCDKIIDLLNLSTISSLNSYYSNDEKIEFIDIIPSFDSQSNYYEVITNELNNNLQRDILFDRVLSEMSFAKISETYNLNIRNVKKLYNDAIYKLRNSNINYALQG